MTSILSRILALGTEGEPVAVARTTRLLNLISLITAFAAIAFSTFYLLFLSLYWVALYNFVFTLSYLFVLLLTAMHHHKFAKICFFLLLMLHIFACSNVFMTKDSGFHLYYFLVPTGVLLVFQLEEKYCKVLLSLGSALLFLYCENSVNENPMIVVSDKVNHLLYQSVFLINMLEVIFVLTLFSKQIERHQWHLTKLASTDGLTGLDNRRHFFERGEQLLQQDNHASYHFNLLLVDLDYFKAINDKYGHAVGDNCLIEAANLLNKIPIKNKFCARIGGEEFVVILPNCGPQRAIQVAQTVRENWKNTKLLCEQGTIFTSTMSIGISNNLNKKENLKDILAHADLALYQAKKSGRNQVVVYENK